MALRVLREEAEMAGLFAGRSGESGSESRLPGGLDSRARRLSDVADRLEELIRERAPRSEERSEEAV